MAFVSSFNGALLQRPHAAIASVAATCVRASAAPSGLSRRALLSGAFSAAAAAALSASPALADHTQQAARRSYDRYFPRISQGLDEVQAVREAISAGDLAKAKELTEAKTFDVKFRRALSIYATSFSDSNINKQSLELLSCVSGFFGGVDKATTAESKEAAVEDWNKAAEAMATYIRVARLAKLKDTTLTI